MVGGPVETHRRGPAPAQAGATLHALVDTCGDDDAGIRDRALLLILSTGRIRRSEIGGLLVRHLVVGPVGLRILIAESRTGQEGRWVGIPRSSERVMCAACAWGAWREHARLIQGQPAFHGLRGPVTTRGMSARAVVGMLRRRARAAGLA